MVKIEEHLKELDRYYSILNNPIISPLEKISTMKHIYLYIKQISLEYYSNGRLNPMYSLINKKIDILENSTPNGFIIPSIPITREVINPSSSEIDILDYIIYQTRSQLQTKYQNYFGTNVDFTKLSLTNECINASTIVNRICKELGLNSTGVYINPGFNPSINLMRGSGFHYFNIVIINNKKYLIDCTYRQFFTLYRNFIERIGIIGTNGCKPGLFMTMTKERLSLAKELTTKGYIELTQDNLKNYLDGFTLSYRNGLYYEKTNDFSYNPTYTYEDYVRFLNEEDSQINHEGIEAIGIQKKPLSNPNLHF